MHKSRRASNSHVREVSDDQGIQHPPVSVGRVPLQGQAELPVPGTVSLDTREATAELTS